MPLQAAVKVTGARLKQRKKYAGIDFEKLHEAFQRVGGEAVHAIGKTELKVIVDYKMAKGSFRPGFWSRIDQGNSEEQVQKASKSAIAAIRRIRDCDDVVVEDLATSVLEALEKITVLHGVGLATATYTLARFSSIVPIMSDEALRWSSNLSPKDRVKGYSKKDFSKLFEKLFVKVKDLNTANLTIRSLSEEIWASAVTACPLKELKELSKGNEEEEKDIGTSTIQKALYSKDTSPNPAHGHKRSKRIKLVK